jgi:hypothetical protein
MKCLLTVKKGPRKGNTMKKTVGICMLTIAASLAAPAAFAASTAAIDAHTSAAPDSAARWSMSAMDRHMPLETPRPHKLAQQKFRYMDMAQAKRSKSLRNAVLVYGGGMDRPARDTLRDPAKAGPQAPLYRQDAPVPAPRVIMRPST